MRPIRIAKKLVATLLCLLAALACGVAPLAYADTGASDTLTVGAPADRCPVFYLDQDTHEVTGIGVDLMRMAAEEAGYTVSFTVVKEETLKQALDNAEYDVIMPFGSAISSAAGHPSVVSDNLIQTPFTLVTTGNRNLPPLNELKVGMLSSLGGVAETVQQLYPGIEISFYETMDECVQALRTGQVDALLHNSYVWSYVLQKPSYADLSVQPSAMFTMDFRAGALDTPKGRATIERLNGGIATLTDTRQQAVVLDHTSRRLYRYDLSDYLYQYGLFMLLGGLLLVALMVIAVQKQRALRVEQERELQRLIDHDSLTGVLSLDGFRKRVEELLRANPDVPYLLSYNNIKDFKFINDSLGMEAGDELLRFWVDRSREVLSDKETIGRIGSDHFAMLRIAGGEEQMAQDEREVLDPVRNYFIQQGKDKRVQVCSGVYVLEPDDYRQIDVDHMLDFARVAEKRVRDTVKDGYEFYNPKQWEKEQRVADIVGHLPLAIRAGEIQVWYQPQVNYQTGELMGAEALCRWNHAKLGWLRPAEFIPTLEDAGRIFDLDRYVWDQVCQDLSRWNKEGFHRYVSVNLSRCDITDERNIPGHFYDLVQAYGLSVDQLRIEITETAYVEDADLLIRTTMKLREFGFQVEMDDFGSGYSSLHMLKEVPVDRIKLDLHFLTGTGDGERSRVIVSHIIQMVHDLGMDLIAEGVENAAQANFLLGRGCKSMQGYYFHKPMSVKDFEGMLASGERMASAPQA